MTNSEKVEARRRRSADILMLRMRAMGHDVFAAADYVVADMYHPKWEGKIRACAEDLSQKAALMIAWMLRLADNEEHPEDEHEDSGDGGDDA